MKLSKFEKQQRRAQLERLAQMGGRIDSCPIERLTVAVVPANTYDEEFWNDGQETEFFYVSASYCSGSDEFRRKRGELIAIDRLFGGEFLRVPAAGRSADEMLTNAMQFVSDLGI